MTLTGSRVDTPVDRRGSGRIPLVAALVAGVIGLLLLLVVVAAVLQAVLDRATPTSRSPGTGVGPPAVGAAPASPEALEEIPEEFFLLYAEAAAFYGIDWAVLAGIGKVECDHGRSTLDGCGGRGTVNEAGARGPMQFLGSTWRAGAGTFEPDVAGPPVPDGQERRGYATDGNGDGVADPWEPADAIFSAARMLAHNGAPDDYDTAVFAYNHSRTYVDDVMDHALSYRAGSDDPDHVDAVFLGGSGDVPLSTVPCREGGTTEVHSQLVPVLHALYAQAPHAFCGGGYRSPARQVETRRNNCGSSGYAIYEMPSSQCSPPTARPGNSMHEQGLAIDLTCDGVLIQSRTNPCFQWLDEHAGDYWLHNLPSEPWHWSSSGT
jgi:hypothetical protein